MLARDDKFQFFGALSFFIKIGARENGLLDLLDVGLEGRRAGLAQMSMALFSVRFTTIILLPWYY